MPMSITTTAGGPAYTSPFVGRVDKTHHLKVDISGLTTAEVDADGYLKPGVPLRQVGGLGVLVSGATQAIDGVTVEATKIAADNAAGTLAAAADCFVAVATHCVVNLDLAEDNLGRPYSANELAAMAAAFVMTTST